MTSLGYASKSASPEDDSSSFIVDNTPRSRRPHVSQNGSFSKPPSPQRDLRIEVPPSSATGALADAFEFHETEPLPSPNFNNITQLPTPVLPSGSFQAHSPVKSGKLDIRKRNTGVHALERNRIVSAFAPEPHMKLRMDVSPVSTKSSSQTRHISNPGNFPPSEPGSQIPSPPSEPDIASFKGRILLAPTTQASYVCEDVVGSGAFSTVVAARDTTASHTVVAVKIISFPSDDFTSMSSFRSFIVRELGILSHLSHPCIIKLLDYNVSPLITLPEINEAYESGETTKASTEDLFTFSESQQYFFLEFCSGGNLFNWLSNNYTPMGHTKAFWRLAARVVAELMVAVGHMHKRRIIHRDIKLENVLLNDNFDCVALCEDPRLSSRPMSTITDFGLSKRLTSDDQLLTTKCGSQDYVSPELLMGLKYDGKLLDAWAIGVLVYSIIENRLPFDLPPPELMQASGISPSVLKRRRTKHSPAHRIAMIDWDWYRAVSMQQDSVLDNESKKIISNLQKLVDVFLVRKEKRMTVQAVIESEDFAWIKACVPSQFYS